MNHPDERDPTQPKARAATNPPRRGGRREVGKKRQPAQNTPLICKCRQESDPDSDPRSIGEAGMSNELKKARNCDAGILRDDL
jgi:hypothetical protein